MKKTLLALGILLLFVPLIFAAQVNLSFYWTQTLPSPNDLAGCGLYQASAAGGPYTKIADIQYVSQQDEYTISQTITVADGQANLYFVLDAVDTNGNRSAKSNELSVPIPDIQAPNAPVQLRIIIISSGGTS